LDPLILYVGGSHPQRRAVRDLVRAGFEVHVTDRSIDPPCSAETPFIHRIDATDVSGMLELAGALQGRGRLIGAYGIGDYAFPSVAAVNRMIGGRNPPADAVQRMIDKAATKEALARSGVPMAQTLWAGRASAFEPADLRPDASVDDVIVKPVGVHASRGITQVPYRDNGALQAAVTAAGHESEHVLVEEFLTGDICNFDALMIEGEVVPVSMTYRIAHDTLSFLPSAQVQPAWNEVKNGDELLAIGRLVAKALGYHNGPFTIDYVQTKNGPRVLEVSPHLHSIALEVMRGNGNPLRGWFRYTAGEAGWRDDLDRSAETAGALIMLRATRLGVLKGIEGEAALQCDALSRDYFRCKPDGSSITSLSAAGGLVSLGWLAGGGASHIEDVARSHMRVLNPVIASSQRELELGGMPARGIGGHG
jgi:hypothetical protein